MNALRYRALSLITTALLVLSLGVMAEEAVDETVLALRNLDKSVAGNQLGQAESQLQALQARIPGDTRLEQAQREISAAYLRQGESALKAGNLAGASQALGKAQQVMPAKTPQANALSSAIERAQEKQAAATIAEQQAAQAQAKAAAESAERARQQKLAAERKAAELKKAPAAAATPVIPVAPAAPKASLIDPQAASSVINLPMLDTKDNDSLRNLLDQVAADVVALRCTVKVEVRQSKDYPWVAALLSARVKKLDPSFNLQLEQAIDPAKDPRLVLTPQP